MRSREVLIGPRYSVQRTPRPKLGGEIFTDAPRPLLHPMACMRETFIGV